MKKILLVLGVLLAGALAVVLFLFNKPHRDVAEEEAKFEVEANKLVDDYKTAIDQATTTYLDQVVMVSGHVTKIEANSITINEGVYCQMNEGVDLSKISVDQAITVKGRVVGFDDLFGEVRMDFCSFPE